MLKYFSLLLSMIAVMGFTFLWFQGNDSQEFAYVDTGRILTEYSEMKNSEGSIEKMADIYKANIDTLQTELQAEVMNYEKNNFKMSDSEKELSKKLIRSKQDQLSQYEGAVQQKIRERANSMRGEITEKINRMIRDYGDMHNYDIILGTANGNIVYAGKGMDITDEMLSYLESSSGKK